MFKQSCIIISLFLVSCVNNTSGIPEEAGNWRVEVGQAGNEFYEIPTSFKAKPPSEALLKLVRDIAPANTEIKKWEQEDDGIYFIKAESGPEKYLFVVSSDTKLLELMYENKSTNVSEVAEDLVLKGSKKSIDLLRNPWKNGMLG